MAEEAHPGTFHDSLATSFGVAAGDGNNTRQHLDAEKGLGMAANRPKQPEELDARDTESHAQS
jgi:hypothetical protein